MNQMKNRMQALGLLDRSIKAATDDELTAAIDALDDDHREGLQTLVDPLDAETVRSAARAGRIDGGMEAIAAVLTDACLADCIEALGDHADNPSSDQLREVLPGIIEDHGVGITRIMLSSTVAGEAPASAIIRDLLKTDEQVALPKAEEPQIAPLVEPDTGRTDEEQSALRAKRVEARKVKQEAARIRREQSAAARRRK